ncbi:MAG: DUF1730 domain-containing protein [Clostridia bacterium]|nr:DUF1730 domain-containing protein [Clostridia bacterium]
MTLDLSLFSPLPAGVCSFGLVADKLLDVRSRERVPEGAASVICCLFPYYLGEEAYEGRNQSRYSVPADYHIVAREKLGAFCEKLALLYPGNVFVPFADSSPLPEVYCAVMSGLGVMGKNRLCINPEYGSWFFIGEIVTDAAFDPTPPEKTVCCGCGECLRACPTGALTDAGIDPEKCLSCLSQKKGELDAETARLMKKYNCAWGCDVCQEACPMNRGKKLSPVPEFYATAKAVFDPENAGGDRAYLWRGKKTALRNAEVLESR